MHDLKASDFKNGSIINRKIKGKHGMLLIHAEWCGHCKRFMPDFESIDKVTGDEYICARLEDTELNAQMSKSLGVKGFPTIKFFDLNGKIVSEYPSNIPRTYENILKHICDVYHYCINHKR